MQRDDSGAGTVVVAFVLGAITGAAVALLMAPASGEETRRLLAEKAREGREKAGEAARQGRELWDRQRETLTTAFERGKEAYEQARSGKPGTPSGGGRVSDWNQAFLGVIAVSTALMAIMQIGAIVVLARVATQVRDIVATLQQDIRPLIARANVIADEAAKTATLATVQAQKIDKLVTDLTRRVDETSAIVQQAIITPAREGMAIVAALKAGLGALRGFKDFRGRPGRMDDEDPLFIG